MNYQEIEGDLISLALENNFDVIAHGVNCFCTMKSGLAPQMAEVFGCDKFDKEYFLYKGDINKLGQIEAEYYLIKDGGIDVHCFDPVIEHNLAVVNCYTQYKYGKYHEDGIANPLDYEALTLCLKKMNHIFKGKHIGLPQIGCGKAEGDWNIVKQIIQKELKDCQVTVVIYKP